jgi:hypothetical protein
LSAVLSPFVVVFSFGSANAGVAKIVANAITIDAAMRDIISAVLVCILCVGSIYKISFFTAMMTSVLLLDLFQR